MYTFSKEERLCSQKLSDKLFHSGSSFLLYPFRIIFLNADELLPAKAQVLISVPKRRFKHAVDRNLIKRRIREIYRLNKSEKLYAFLPERKTLLLGIGYVGNEIHEYAYLEERLLKAIKNLQTVYKDQAEGKGS